MALFTCQPGKAISQLPLDLIWVYRQREAGHFWIAGDAKGINDRNNHYAAPLSSKVDHKASRLST
jgi:hypothetical protein